MKEELLPVIETPKKRKSYVRKPSFVKDMKTLKMLMYTYITRLEKALATEKDVTLLKKNYAAQILTLLELAFRFHEIDQKKSTTRKTKEPSFEPQDISLIQTYFAKLKGK